LIIPILTVQTSSCFSFIIIIPFSDGQALYDACQAEDKTFLEIPGANHNDIFLRGMSEYMTAVSAVVEKVKSNRTSMK